MSYNFRPRQIIPIIIIPDYNDDDNNDNVTNSIDDNAINPIDAENEEGEHPCARAMSIMVTKFEEVYYRAAF